MSRLSLHEKLVKILPNVYYQPSANVSLKYPCIVYEHVENDSMIADDNIYVRNRMYQVTVIETAPESSVEDKILIGIPYASFSNKFVTDNLYHSVFNVYDIQPLGGN